MGMAKHGSTIDAVVLPKHSLKALCAKPPKKVKLTTESWGDSDFVGASIGPDSTIFDKKISKDINDTYFVADTKKVKFLTAFPTYTDAAGKTGNFVGWFAQHDLVLAQNLPAPLVAGSVLPLKGYFRAVAVYTP